MMGFKVTWRRRFEEMAICLYPENLMFLPRYVCNPIQGYHRPPIQLRWDFVKKSAWLLGTSSEPSKMPSLPFLSTEYFSTKHYNFIITATSRTLSHSLFSCLLLLVVSLRLLYIIFVVIICSPIHNNKHFTAGEKNGDFLFFPTERTSEKSFLTKSEIRWHMRPCKR